MSSYREILDWFALHREASHSELERLIATADPERLDYAMGLAREVAVQNYGHGVFVRGLVEVSNRCVGGCYYCGLRTENRNINRYALSEEEIVEACKGGYELGLRSVVLQGGEVYDMSQKVASVVGNIKSLMPDVAVTLSLGEQDAEVYELWRKAGADRYLLRHETATKGHYARLHPERMRYDNRQRCLANLKTLGYQVGAGFMVGSPFQGTEELAHEIEYLLGLQPPMVGIGPYIPQCDTPFANQKRGSVERTLLMVSLVRMALPKALIPSTTALASSDAQGMTRGVLAGANVVMPNITPHKYRADYAIYDGKKSSGTEAGEGLRQLQAELGAIGYEAVLTRGDHLDFMKR
ncbi:MAG: [FeFe] hydrogenase H-cluster radical SAM maturase HydE [Tidjanibacter sp.]|nr:[FeFe] hydrogenase H-cluster radical SAM maturase HydE [Tidjanibacter sp.]